MNQTMLGIVRGLGVALLTTTIAYFADPAHLTFLSASTGALISAMLLSLEHYIEGDTGRALFGAVRSK
jgi:hypothetical protein